jgi:hypothetical protein
VNNGKDGEGKPAEPLDGAPDPGDVHSRAEGRPPEERSSADPKAQAENILQESEDRISEGAEEFDH